jgi:hypothetical protein
MAEENIVNINELKEAVESELLGDAAVEEKKYNLRPLVATDMGQICKIITAVGVRQFKEAFNQDDIKGKSVEAAGIDVLLGIAGIAFSNIPKAEEEIQTFVASVTGMSLDQVRHLPFADYGEIILDIVTKQEFQDFFGRVMKLFNR